MLRHATRLRWVMVLGSAVLAAGLVLDGVQAQPGFRPPAPPVFRPPTPPGMNPGNPFPNNPGFKPPQMPGVGGPIFKNVWTCGKCGREIGEGAFPPATCPYCGARLANGIGPADPKYGGNPNAGANPGMPAGPPGMPNMPNMPGIPNTPPAQQPDVNVPGPGINPPIVQEVNPNASGGNAQSVAGTPVALRVVLVLAAGLAALVLIVVVALVIWGVAASQTGKRPRRRGRRDDDEDDDLPPPRRRPRAAPAADTAPLPRAGIRSRRTSD